MPMDEAGHEVQPDDAYKAGNCPECGEPLKGVNLQHHADRHWTRPIGNDPQYKEARRRRQMVLDYKEPTQEPAKEESK